MDSIQAKGFLGWTSWIAQGLLQSPTKRILSSIAGCAAPLGRRTRVAVQPMMACLMWGSGEGGGCSRGLVVHSGSWGPYLGDWGLWFKWIGRLLFVGVPSAIQHLAIPSQL